MLVSGTRALVTENASEYRGCRIGWSVLEELCLLNPPRHKRAIYFTCSAFNRLKKKGPLYTFKPVRFGLCGLSAASGAECWSTEAQVVHSLADPRETGDGLGRYTLTVYQRGMLSVLSYGRIVARAVLGGLSQTDGRDYSLITASCGFGKDFRKGILKKGMCYGDDACFIARHKSADVLGE